MQINEIRLKRACLTHIFSSSSTLWFWGIFHGDIKLLEAMWQLPRFIKWKETFFSPNILLHGIFHNPGSFMSQAQKPWCSKKNLGAAILGPLQRISLQGAMPNFDFS